MIIDATSQEHFNELIKGQRVLVDFWAPWCGPCKAFFSVLKAIEPVNHGLTTIVKVNFDELPDLVKAQSVLALPTLVIYSEGKEVKRSAGAMTRTQFEQFLDAN